MRMIRTRATLVSWCFGNEQAKKPRGLKILRNEIDLFWPLPIIPLVWWTLPSEYLILLRLPTFWWLTRLEGFEGLKRAVWNILLAITRCCQRGLPTFWWRGRPDWTVCQRVMGKLFNCNSTISRGFKLSQKKSQPRLNLEGGVASCKIPPFFAVRLHFGLRTQRSAPNPKW